MGALGLGKTLGVTAEERLSRSIETETHATGAGEALARLKEGNQRFMDEKPLHSNESASWRSLLLETQKPFATVLGCSDSRVPPELVFDVGFGDLFTIRLAGNIIAEDVIGTLQYAVAHLHHAAFIVVDVSIDYVESINCPLRAMLL